MTTSPVDTPTFAELGLAADLVQAVSALGYEEPTPIQSAAIPVLLQGRDLLGLAATGTGKTAAFTLPLLHHLDGSRPGAPPRALVVVPTRELAMQVAQAVHVYGKARGVHVLAVYGGASFGHQVKALQRGVDVVVATPGRALDHLRRGTLRLDCVGQVVLDEADEMLDMGFQEDIEALLAELPEQRQAALFSATFPSHLRQIANRVLRDPVRVEVEPEEVEAGEVPRVRQIVYLVQHAYKEEALARVLDMEAPDSTLVFCRTRTEVDALSNALAGRGYRAEALHGGLSQQARDRVMDRLRNQAADLVVATDVAARGIDIEHLTHVINFDLPTSPEQYLHRIGRVGRAGREGIAITLAEPREHRLLKNIERVIKMQIPVEQVPTVADLRNRRMELTLSSLRETIMVDDLNQFRVIVDTLADEFDVVEVALAAIKLAHEATAGADDDAEEIPSVSLKPEKKSWEKKATHPGATTRGPGDKRRGGKDVGGSDAGRPKLQGRAAEEGFTRLFVGTGRKGGIRPQDLVGAICGETDLQGRQIGAIEITDNFSLVEVPSGSAEQVIKALGNTTIKGRKTSVRRERF